MTSAKIAVSAVKNRRRGTMALRLYVAGRGPNSVRALDSLRAMFSIMAIQPEFAIIDVLHSPESAMGDGIIVTPTLVRMRPSPVIRIIGDLTDGERVLSMLGLASLDSIRPPEADAKAKAKADADADARRQVRAKKVSP